jgi:hypothetical protein
MPPSEKNLQMPQSVNDSKQSHYHVTYRTISFQPHHAGTFVFLTFPSGHEEITPPIGGGFSDARFAFSSEKKLIKSLLNCFSTLTAIL